MSENNEVAAATAEASAVAGPAKWIYILYLVGLIVPFASLVGLIMAYVNKGAAPQWIQTHYQFQIRTFWIGFLYFLISFLLMFVVVGWLTLLVALVWYIVRCVKGLSALNLSQEHPNPTGWLF